MSSLPGLSRLVNQAALYASGAGAAWGVVYAALIISDASKGVPNSGFLLMGIGYAVALGTTVGILLGFVAGLLLALILSRLPTAKVHKLVVLAVCVATYSTIFDGFAALIYSATHPEPLHRVVVSSFLWLALICGPIPGVAFARWYLRQRHSPK